MPAGRIIRTVIAAGLGVGLAGAALAQDVVKIGMILPMTGPFASTGRQIEANAKLYMAQNGTTVAGKKIELIVKDDAGVPDNTKRIAQELIVNDKVAFLAGFGLTPLALATAPLATEAKVPMVVMAAATSVITENRRTSCAPVHAATGHRPHRRLGREERNQEGRYAGQRLRSGIDAEAFRPASRPQVARSGRSCVCRCAIRFRAVPATRARRQAGRGVRVRASGVGAAFMKQFTERGLDKSGIRLIGTGDVTDDDILNDMGDVALGVVTVHYSANHNSAVNKAYVTDYKKANPTMRPNFHGVGGYDGMQLIYKALEATKGSTNGDALIAAMKGMAWESPRGPITIDAQLRETTQNVYIRKVERVGGELYNVEFETIPAVKDPTKAPK